ncbi:MAG: tetratricopeptide repeat protein, partial [Phycisphaerales bacterium]
RELLSPSHPVVSTTLESMRATGVIWGQLDEARAHGVAAASEHAIRTQIRPDEPGYIAAVNMLVRWGIDTGWRRKFANDPDAYSRVAIDLFDRALGLYLEVLPETNSDVALVREFRVRAVRELGDYPRALEAATQWGVAVGRVLPPDHWVVRLTEAYRGEIELLLGNPGAAVELLERSIGPLEGIPGYAEYANNLAERAAQAYAAIGRPEDAARWETKAAEWCKRVGAAPVTRAVLARALSAEQSPLLEAMARLQDTLAAGSPDAGPAMLEFIRLRSLLCPPEDPAAYMVWYWSSNLAITFESGRTTPGVTKLILHRLHEQNLEHLRRLPRIPEQAYGFLPYRVAFQLCQGVDPELSPAESLARAEKLLRECIATMERFDPDHHYLHLERSWLGYCLYLQGRSEEALAAMGDCLARIAVASGAGSSYTSTALWRVCLILMELGRYEDARREVRVHLAREGALGMNAETASFCSFVLLEGEGQTREEIELALAASRRAAAAVPAPASAEPQLLRALTRAGLNAEAEELAGRMFDRETLGKKTPSQVNVLVWNLVKTPGLRTDWAGRAADAQRSVAEANPKNGALANTLAVALLRAGRVDDALALVRVGLTSQRSDGFTRDPSAGDHAVLVMCLHRLGRNEEAKAALAAIPAALTTPPLDGDDRLMLTEARRMLGVSVPPAAR